MNKAQPFRTSGTIQYAGHPVAWFIAPAAHAKGQCALTADSVDGFKSKPHYLAEAENARYSNRDKAYIMSPAKARHIVAQLQEV